MIRYVGYVIVMNQLLRVFLFTAMEGREWILEMTYNPNRSTSGACTFAGRNLRVWRPAYGGYITFTGVSRKPEGRRGSPERRLNAARPLRVSELIRFQHVDSVFVQYAVELCISCGL